MSYIKWGLRSYSRHCTFKRWLKSREDSKVLDVWLNSKKSFKSANLINQTRRGGIMLKKTEHIEYSRRWMGVCVCVRVRASVMVSGNDEKPRENNNSYVESSFRIRKSTVTKGENERRQDFSDDIVFVGMMWSFPFTFVRLNNTRERDENNKALR